VINILVNISKTWDNLNQKLSLTQKMPLLTHANQFHKKKDPELLEFLEKKLGGGRRPSEK